MVSMDDSLWAVDKSKQNYMTSMRNFQTVDHADRILEQFAGIHYPSA